VLVTRVLPQLSNSSSVVRSSAARCCAALAFSGCTGWRCPCGIDADGAFEHEGREHVQAILSVQAQLLNVAVADPDSDVRLLALQLLGREFDATLASQEACRTLFPALNDKPAIRHCAMRLLGRLSRRNPGCVFPILRRTIIQCSTELHLLDHVRRQEQAATLLGTLVDAAPALVAPYAPALLQGMATKLSADPPAPAIVITAVLATVTRLVLHVPEASLDAVRALTPVVVTHVLDDGPQGRRVEALRALTSIVRATHDVDLYQRYPQLLRHVTGMLHGGRKEGWATRQDVLAFLGAIGAIDPGRVKAANDAATAAGDDAEGEGEAGQSAAMAQLAFGRGLDDEALARYAIQTALAVVSQSSVDDECCKHASRAICRILETRKLPLRASVATLRRVVPEVLKQIPQRPKIREGLFCDLSDTAEFVAQHVRAFLQAIYPVAAQYLSDPDAAVVRAVVRLLMELRRHLNEELAPFIPHLLPLMVRVADERQNEPTVVVSILGAFQAFGSLLAGHLHVVLPSVIDIAVDSTADLEARTCAIRSVRVLAAELPALADHASRVIHALCRVMSDPPTTARADHRTLAKMLASEAYEALRALMILLGPRYARYDHSVRHVMARHYAEAPHRYSEFLSFSATVTAADRPAGHHPHIEPPPQSHAFRPSRSERDGDDSAVAAPDPRFTTAIDHLSRVSSVGEDEWGSWLRQLCKALLADCQATPLRVCVDLARVHEPSARALFHPTFAACFVRMPANMTRVVVARLGQVLESPRTPKEVVQDLLNLVEYLERIEDMTLRGRLYRDRARRGAGHGLGAFTADADDTVWCLGGLFELSTLVEQSERCNLFAKALHYAELQFTQLTRLPLRAIAAGRPVKLPDGRWEALLNICEKTIGLYSRLGAQESANGVLDFVQRNYGALTGARGEFRVANADMYEKLQWWSEAFRVYQRIYRQTNQAPALAGMLRSLDALGDFQGVHDMWRAALRHRHRLPKREIPALAQYGARAAWLLQRWDDLSEATGLMSSDGYDLTTQHFYRAMVAMRRGDVDSTRASIADCRRSLDRDLSAVMAESYDRAYPLLIGLHQLSELEELSALNTCAAMSLPRLSALWRQRLDALATSAVEWQGTLVNHSMALNPEDDLEPWLRFITICVRGQRYRMAEAILQRLLRTKDVAAGIVMTHPVAGQQPKTTILAPTPPAASPTMSESVASPPPPPAESPTVASAISTATTQQQQQPPPHRQQAAVAIAAAQFLYDVGRSQQATESLTTYAQILANEVNLEAAAVVPVVAEDPSSPLADITRTSSWGMSRRVSDLAGQSVAVGRQPFVAALSGGSGAFPCPSVSTARRELSRALVKLADWKIADTAEFWRKPEELQDILATIDDAREHDPHHIGAWRQWAAVSKACATTTSRTAALSKTELERFLLNAAEGYLRCIESSELLQQDVLSLLSVWFAYGGAFPAVAARVTDAIQLVPNDAWLRVVPQIMARVHTHEEAITRGVRKLLLSIAGNHPQALLFPLHVCVYATATGSDVLKRRDGAIDVLNEVANVHGDRGARMVRDAALVSEELIACAIISIERWYDVIEEAWRAFLQHPTLKGDVRVMHSFFAPLVALLDVPRNEADRRFVSTYGDSLRAMFDHVQAAVNRVEAGQWTATTAEESHEDPDVKAAWEILTRVHENLEAECRGIQALTIALVSPRLEESCAGDEPLAVAVPGHYRPASRSPYIARFDSDLRVMGSKNRPRKAAIIGDDGVRYKHMIKGQEDMRLDERVMQLLGLVNALFEAHIRTANKRMAATTYAVTPLNDNVGLVGWVDGCDTLHDVIRKYRAAVDIPASREYKLIDFESGGSPERLSLMQKMDVFEFAIDDADSAEIARSMWVSSASAEAWLEARTTFLRTLGSMSMVGFVLGLGDRHPSNLMLSRSGAVVHIDFGDCFEVAMLRHNIPERVPFRLTRMLEKAMEPAGISGLFRTTCEAVMSVLRSERDNLMSMLEAFVHDPLITWRIVAADEAAAASASVAGPGSMATGPSGNAAAVVPASLAATSLAARALNPDRNGDMAVGSMSRVVPSSARFPAPIPENFVPSSFAAQGAATSVLLQSVRAPQQLDGPPVAEHTRRARQLVDRVRDKLMGQEDPRIPPCIEERVPRPQAPVPSQVDRLIRQATSHENLCQAWKGWCAFW
jgi:FKBP12-rapamycin complex-associated protein